MGGWLFSFLGRRSVALSLVLVNRITRPLAVWWWVGPLLVVFAWGAVPIMRRRHNIMKRDDYSLAARFWWAPGWPWIGLVGAGFSLVVAPLLYEPLAARWAPSAWLGADMDMSVREMGLCVLVGLSAIVWGLKLYIAALVSDRKTRYRAWRFRQGSRAAAPVVPDGCKLPPGCPFAEACARKSEGNEQEHG